MARKLTRNETKQPASGAAGDKGASDLSILLPDVTVTIAGRTVTVREYRFADGLEARAKGKPLADSLLAMMEAGDVAEANIEDYLDLLALHGPLVRELMATSIEGADAEWIKSLEEEDGRLLMLTWWGVAGRFFVRLALRKSVERTRRAIEALLKKQAEASAGQTSSPSSPQPATASPPSSSANTPSVN